MHRSGTSALTGVLRQAGLYLGEVLDQGFTHNRSGLQEAASILYMHNDLLQKNGGDWFDPPEQVEWGKLHLAVRDLFIESRRGQPLWGFKDPRTVLVLQGWLDVLPAAKLVGVFRHPLEVARSLNARNGMAIEAGVQLWETYNRRLLDWYQQRPFPLIDFSASEEEVRAAMAKATRALGLDDSGGAALFAGALRRNQAEDSEPPPEPAAALLKQLQTHAL